jgi:hypothetical protein
MLQQNNKMRKWTKIRPCRNDGKQSKIEEREKLFSLLLRITIFTLTIFAHQQQKSLLSPCKYNIIVD